MKPNFHQASASSRFRPLLAVAVLAGLASLPGQADVLDAKPVTTCAGLSESTVHEYTILLAIGLEAAGDVPEHCRVLGVLPPDIVFEVVQHSE